MHHGNIQLGVRRAFYRTVRRNAVMGGLLMALGCAYGQTQPPLADTVPVTFTTPSAEDAHAANILASDWIEVAIRNRSDKDIVAYAVSVTAQAQDGSRVAGANAWDLVPSFGALVLTGGDAPNIVSKYQHFGPLRPGQVSYEIIHRPTDQEGRAIPTVAVSIQAALFGDNTIGGDRSALEHLFDEHLGAAEELDAVVARMRVPAVGTTRDRVASWGREFAPTPEVGRIGPASGVDVRQRRKLSGHNEARKMVSRALTNLGSGGDDISEERIERLTKYWAAEAEGYRSHSGEGTDNQ
jgi:hypothetical protein